MLLFFIFLIDVECEGQLVTSALYLTEEAAQVFDHAQSWYTINWLHEAIKVIVVMLLNQLLLGWLSMPQRSFYFMTSGQTHSTEEESLKNCLFQSYY